MDKKAIAANMSIHLLNGCKTDPELRLKKTAFTRERKLGAERILHMLLHRLSGPLQLELDAYFEEMEESPVSKQAFSKARANLNPEFVRKFADGIAEIHAQDPDAPNWKGMRLIVIDGTDGEVEVLLTNLDEVQLPLAQAAELYFKRWGIETAYDILKSKFQLENFSGQTVVSVFQDFYATIYLAGFAEICAAQADQQIADHDRHRNLKYDRKANRNRSIAKLHNQFWRILLQPDPILRERMMEHLCEDIACRPGPVRPGRSPSRKHPRNKRFYAAKKSVLP